MVQEKDYGQEGVEIDALITDLDGTLCDTMMANIAAYEQAFHDASLSFSLTDYKQSFGLRFDEMFDRLAPEASEDQRLLVKKNKVRHYAENVHLVVLNEGLLALLKTYKYQGKKIALATTAQSVNARVVLKHFGIDTLFDEVIFGEEVKKGKPDPECYNLLIEKLEVKPDRCLIFEDSEYGIQAAQASGAHALKVAL